VVESFDGILKPPISNHFIFSGEQLASFDQPNDDWDVSLNLAIQLLRLGSANFSQLHLVSRATFKVGDGIPVVGGRKQFVAAFCHLE